MVDSAGIGLVRQGREFLQEEKDSDRHPAQARGHALDRKGRKHHHRPAADLADDLRISGNALRIKGRRPHDFIAQFRCTPFCILFLHPWWFRGTHQLVPDGSPGRLASSLEAAFLRPCSFGRDSNARLVPVTPPIVLKPLGLSASNGPCWPPVPLLASFPALNLPKRAQQPKRSRDS